MQTKRSVTRDLHPPQQRVSHVSRLIKVRSRKPTNYCVCAQLQDSSDSRPHEVSRRHALLTSAGALPLFPAAAAWAEPTRKKSSGSAASRNAYLPPLPQVELAPGVKVSKVIRGCWQLCGGHEGDPRTSRTEPPELFQDLETCQEAGMTAVATSDAFGPSESLLGQYLRLHPHRKGHLQTLVEIHPTASPGPVTRETVEYAVKASALRLGVPKADLVFLSWPDWEVEGCVEAAKYLAEAQQKGLLGGVGLSNFDVAHLIPIVESGVKVVCNQVQYSLVDRRPQLLLTEYCQRHNISLLPYGVLAGGFIADKYLGMPAAKAKLDTMSKMKYGAVIGQVGGWDYFQQLLQVLKPIAKKHGTSISNVASRWVLQQPQVPAIILGARNALHVQDHQRLFSFQLDSDDLFQIEVACESCPQPPTTDCHVWERGGTW